MIILMEYGTITKNGKVFVSKDYEIQSPFIFAMTTKDHKPNVMLFNAIKHYNFWKNFIANYKAGVVYYETQSIKHEILSMLKQINA